MQWRVAAMGRHKRDMGDGAEERESSSSSRKKTFLA